MAIFGIGNNNIDILSEKPKVIEAELESLKLNGRKLVNDLKIIDQKLEVKMDEGSVPGISEESMKHVALEITLINDDKEMKLHEIQKNREDAQMARVILKVLRKAETGGSPIRAAMKAMGNEKLFARMQELAMDENKSEAIVDEVINTGKIFTSESGTKLAGEMKEVFDELQARQKSRES